MKIQFGCGKTEFGSVFLALHKKQICKISFSENKKETLKELKVVFFTGEFEEKSATWVRSQWKKLNSKQMSKIELKKQVKNFAHGTTFQKNVWFALLDIPFGETTSYSEIAKKIGSPKAVRAVGSAVGANPFGYLIPCHRVLPKSGGLGGFAWGVKLKKTMLEHEQKARSTK